MCILLCVNRLVSVKSMPPHSESTREVQVQDRGRRRRCRSV